MTYEFQLPDIGEGVVEGEVVRWLVKEGDSLARGPAHGRGDDRQGHGRDPVAPRRPGRAAHVRRGADLPRRQGADRHRRRRRRRRRGGPPGRRSRVPLPRPTGRCRRARRRARRTASTRPDAGVLATPATRKLARDISASTSARSSGTGPDGRITSDDVRARSAAPAPVAGAPRAPQPPRRGARRRPRSRSAACASRSPRTWCAPKQHRAALHLRRGGRLHRSGRAPRARRTTRLAAAGGVKLSFLPFLIKATVAALTQVSRSSTPRSTRRPARSSSARRIPHRAGDRDRGRAGGPGRARRGQACRWSSWRARSIGWPALTRDGQGGAARSSPARRSPSPAWAPSAA